MKIKYFKANSENELNSLLAEFQKSNAIISIQYIPSSFYYSIMVVYEPKEVY